MARTLIGLVGAVTLTLSFGIGQAGTLPNDTVEKASFIVKHFPAASGTDHPPSPIGGGTLSLIGDPDSKTFGVSFNGPLTSSASLTGKEKLVVSLYINCDGTHPGNRVTVGTVDLGRLKAAQPAPTVFAIGDASAFVPLASVTCVSLAIRTDEPDKTPYVVKAFANNDIEVAQDIKVLNSTVNLIGEPDSKSFGVSYRGTLESAIELSGEEKLVAHLYMKCDNNPPNQTSAINVGTAKISEAPKGRGSWLQIVTADVTAFVPLREVECVKLGLQ